MNGGKKGIIGSPSSKCPDLILGALGRNGILSVEDLRQALGDEYCTRTIQMHVKTLLKDKKITGGMKRGADAGIPLYRIAPEKKPRPESPEEFQYRIDQEATYESIRDEP